MNRWAPLHDWKKTDRESGLHGIALPTRSSFVVEVKWNCEWWRIALGGWRSFDRSLMKTHEWRAMGGLLCVEWVRELYPFLKYTRDQTYIKLFFDSYLCHNYSSVMSQLRPGDICCSEVNV